MVYHGLATKLATGSFAFKIFREVVFVKKIYFFIVSRRDFSLMFFFKMIICCFAILLKIYFGSLKLNFVHDGIVLCLLHLFASLKWCLFLKVTSAGN